MKESLQFTEDELKRWLWLRASEWTNWPSYVSQPVVPVLLVLYPWFYVLAGVFCMAVMWTGVRYRYVNVTASNFAVYFVSFVKWPAAIGSAIFLFMRHSYLLGILAIAWPLGLCGLIGVPGQIGRIELELARKVGIANN